MEARPIAALPGPPYIALVTAKRGERKKAKGNAMNKNGNLIEALANSQMYHEYERACLRGDCACPSHCIPRKPGNCHCTASGGRILSARWWRQKAAPAPVACGCRKNSAKRPRAKRPPRNVSMACAKPPFPCVLAMKRWDILQTGQVMRQTPTPQKFDQVVRQLEADGLNVNPRKGQERSTSKPRLFRRRKVPAP